MSSAVLQLPATVTKITINGVDYVGDGSNQITVPSADVSAAQKASFGARGTCINITVVIPPKDPTT